MGSAPACSSTRQSKRVYTDRFITIAIAIVVGVVCGSRVGDQSIVFIVYQSITIVVKEVADLITEGFDIWICIIAIPIIFREAISIIVDS